MTDSLYFAPSEQGTACRRSKNRRFFVVTMDSTSPLLFTTLSLNLMRALLLWFVGIFSLEIPKNPPKIENLLAGSAFSAKIRFLNYTLRTILINRSLGDV